MIEGMVGIAVFTEDKALLDHALTYWAQRVPAYFYNFLQDGGRQPPAPRGDPSWYGQTVFDAATNGVAQETCRDLGHTSYGIAATFNAGETARLQVVVGWGKCG